ncbi:MAG: TIM barrel protein [Caldilineaceae bacterium]|nr:TIM barrel protein [Caldilineaceae bacterium]
MEGVVIGCGQITWRNTPEEQALAEIAQAGYAGAPAGPRPGRSNEETRALFAQYGLKPAPGYLGADFWDGAKEAEILARAHAMAHFAQEAGCTELYVAPGGFTNYVTRRGLTRSQVSGHVTPEDSMTDAEFDQFAKTLNRVGEITLEYGVRSCFHNHVGATIETRDEIDRLLSMVDRSVVFLGPDTGHLAWGGADVVQFCRDYASSIKTMHLKDINPSVLAEGVPAEWDYRTFSDKGIWTELGQGAIDFPTILGILRDAGFGGWLIVETDVTQLPTALESAIVSREYLKGLGY